MKAGASHWDGISSENETVVWNVVMSDGLLALVMFALQVCNYFLLYLLISYALFRVKYKTYARWRQKMVSLPCSVTGFSSRVVCFFVAFYCFCIAHVNQVRGSRVVCYFVALYFEVVFISQSVVLHFLYSELEPRDVLNMLWNFFPLIPQFVVDLLTSQHFVPLLPFFLFQSSVYKRY